MSTRGRGCLVPGNETISPGLYRGYKTPVSASSRWTQGRSHTLAGVRLGDSAFSYVRQDVAAQLPGVLYPLCSPNLGFDNPRQQQSQLYLPRLSRG